MTEFTNHRTAFHEALVALTQFIRTEERLSKGLDKGRLAFFGTSEAKHLSDAEGTSGDAGKAARFLEWYSLDRPFGEGAAAPIQPFLSSGCPGLEQGQQVYVRSLAESRPGVFLVKDLDDSGMDVEDAISGERLSVLLPDGKRSVEAGDTLIGRILPAPGTDLWVASDATERIEGSAVFDAFVEDVERNRLASGQEVLEPVGQLELEVLLNIARGDLVADREQANVASLEEELAKLLTGVSSEIPDVVEILEALKVSPGPGSVMGPLLEALAFHSDLDIESVRHLLVDLWNAYQAGSRVEDSPARGVPSAAPSNAGRRTPSGEEIPVSELGARLLQELEAGEAQGEATEQLFERLEKMIGGDVSTSETDGPPAKIEWKTEDRGNLSALLSEYLWERERMGEPIEVDTATRLTAFVDALKGLRIFDVENLDEEGLARGLVQDWAEGRIDEVLDLMSHLVKWESWLSDVQEIGFGTDIAQFHQALIQDAERLVRIGTEMPVSEGPPDLPSASWHVLKNAAGGWILESAQGRHALKLDCDFIVGDLVLGALGEDGFRPGYRLVPRLLAQALASPQ